MYSVRPNWLMRKFYSSALWRVPTQEKEIFLTFDDGPIPEITPEVLSILEKYKAKATFFCIGDNINKHPDVFVRVKNDGHAIGNHTFNHLKGWATEDAPYLQNFLKCQALTQSNLFRPPYGRIKKSQISKLVSGYSLWAEGLNPQPRHSKHLTCNSSLKIIMWDVLSGDFDTSLSPEKCYRNVIKHTEQGSIVVFHDSLKAFDRLQYALPKVLDYFSKKGYRFSSLAQ